MFKLGPAQTEEAADPALALFSAEDELNLSVPGGSFKRDASMGVADEVVMMVGVEDKGLYERDLMRGKRSFRRAETG